MSIVIWHGFNIQMEGQSELYEYQVGLFREIEKVAG